MKVFAHLSEEPLDGGKVVPERIWSEARKARPIVEIRPGRGEKDLPVPGFSDHCKLPLDFVRCQKIIRVQPLDVISLAELQSMIPSCGSTLVLSGDYRNLFRGKSPCHFGRPVPRTVVDDDDLLALPGLGNGGPE